MQGDKPVGFAGWSFAPRDKAEDWLLGRRDLPYQDSLAGEMFVFNAVEASTPDVRRFLIDQMRPCFQDKEMIYYKRSYNDGRVRPVRLTVNQFVKAHIERKALGDGSN